MTFIYEIRIIIILALITSVAFSIIILICCRKPEKATIVRISAPDPSPMLGIGIYYTNIIVFCIVSKMICFSAQDDQGMIQPDVVFYRRPSTALSFSQWNELNITHPDSKEYCNSLFEPNKWNSGHHMMNQHIPETIDSVSSTCENSRLTTPIRPLAPAYHCNEPLQVQTVKVSSVLPHRNHSDVEFTLPPGYVTTMLETTDKNLS